MAIVTVLGAGMMGSAFCVPMVDAGHEVRLVGTFKDDEIIREMRERSYHPTLKLSLPNSIKPYFSSEFAEAMNGADVLGLGVSSAGIHWATQTIAPHVKANMPVVMITKGLERANNELVVLPDFVRKGLPINIQESVFPAAIAGPCIAGELARRVPTSVVAAGRNRKPLDYLVSLLKTDYYHVFACEDVIGAEVCAALKNAFAMGVALGVGLHEKTGGQLGSIAMHNWESAVFAQAIREMMGVIAMLNGNVMTATGLPGVGDLDVTMNGGRTGRFGRYLGLGMGTKAAIEQMQGATLECLEILQVMRDALPDYESSGKIHAKSFPLLRQLMKIALDDAPVTMPFDDFFAE